MKSNKLIICFYCLVGFKIIKTNWVELPQFSNNEKVYRASIHLDRFLQTARNRTQIISPMVQFNNQRLEQFKKIPTIEKNVSQNELKHSSENSTCATTLPIELTTNENKFSQKNDAPDTSTEKSQNFEKNFMQNYEEKDAEDCAFKRQLNQSNTFRDEVFKMCTTGEEIKGFSNLSDAGINSDKKYANESAEEDNTRFLYYLPITLFKRVHFILKSQPQTLAGKVKFFKNFEKILLSEVETRLSATLKPFTDLQKGNRKRRYDHHEEESLGFPSLEGALMAISFLTFAVYLVRLIMLLFQNFNPAAATSTVFLGRKKRSMDYYNEDVERILGYLNK